MMNARFPNIGPELSDALIALWGSSQNFRKRSWETKILSFGSKLIIIKITIRLHLILKYVCQLTSVSEFVFAYMSCKFK